MVDYKLSNIMLEHDERFFSYSSLYYFSPNSIIKDEATDSSLLLSNCTYDFTTYFNSISNKKWRTYTVVDNVHFHIEVKGKARFIFLSVSVQPIGLGTVELCEIDVDNEDFEVLDYEYPETDADVLGFRVITFGQTCVRDGYYYAKVDEKDIRDIHLALATTTFKKEDYIRKNVALLKEDIKKCNDPVADHVSMIIVDNGRTLDPKELEGDGVYVFPNKNVGGSGGFARGMMEAKSLTPDNPVTHVLIMDDDISLSSESIKRTHNLLSLINDEYKEAFISGAMFSLGDQHRQIEDLGFTSLKGRFGPVKETHVMVDLYQVVDNERALPPRENMYAAFWFCCIPMTTIKREGLPLPLFIRYDDAEYGQRCHPKFITMNGINVWHMDFDDRYNAFYERYCGVRNSLIIQATSGVCSNVDFFDTLFKKRFVTEIKMFNYGSCELMLDAIADYLKGPEFIEIEQCEKLLKEKSAKYEKLVPLEELDIKGIELEQLWTTEKPKSWIGRLHRWTYNGQLAMPERFINKKPVAMRFNADRYPSVLINNRDTILVVNRLVTEGAFRKRDKKRFRDLMKRFRAMVREYEKTHEEVEARYAAASAYLKSDEFWAKYLELDKYQ